MPLTGHSLNFGDTLRFDFGNGPLEKNYIQVNTGDVYSAGRSYGIIPYGKIEAGQTAGNNALTDDYLISSRPFYFTVKVPEGRYKIAITFGNPDGGSATTVKAESRRLMLENVNPRRKGALTKTIVVDVRSPKINDTLSIRRKPREMVYKNWDDQLTLEFNGTKPCVSSIQIESANDLPVIFLAGNSTVVDQEDEPWASWGQMFPCFLKPEIVVANYAESGETLKAFRHENRLEKVLSLMKPGDYLFVEFAHNDQKPGSCHVDPFTTYQDELRYFIKSAREKGGLPVLVTSTNRRKFDENGKIENTLEEYPDAMRQLAKQENVPLIDLNRMSKDLFESLGPENSKKAFVHYPANTFPGQDKPLADNTHFNSYGAYELAKCVVQGIIEQKIDLAKYIVDGWTNFDPKHPDDWQHFFCPDSPSANFLKPDGN